MDYYDLDLAMFGESNTNVTTDQGLSDEIVASLNAMN